MCLLVRIHISQYLFYQPTVLFVARWLQSLQGLVRPKLYSRPVTPPLVQSNFFVELISIAEAVRPYVVAE